MNTSTKQNNTPISTAVEKDLNRRFSELPKYITVFLTILTLIVGMAIWATNSHAEIKDWTAEQDFVTKVELRNVIREQYVPLHEFTKMEQCLEDQKQSMEKIENKLDKLMDQMSQINKQRYR